MRRPLLPLAGLVAMIGILRPAAAQTTRILFLGNSYTGVNSLPTLVEQVAVSLGDTVEASSNMPGGYTFEQHAANPTSLALIDAQPWDFVVLQEQSQRPSFPLAQVQVEVFPFAAQLVDAIRANDSCTTPVFYMTWGRQDGDQRNCPNWPPVCTYAGMQALLRERYLQMTTDNAAACAPAGAAWAHVRDQYPGINLYATDGSHPSMAGSYLVACTMYATFFGRSPVGAYHPTTLHPDTAGLLQAVAATVVLDSLATWNIGALDPDPNFTWFDLGAGTIQFSATSPAAMTHLWSFGDGSTGSGSDPDHSYGAPGAYTVWHVVTDACGRTDSASVDLSVGGVSVPELGTTSPRAWCDAEVVHFDATGAGLLRLVHADGRLAGERRISGPGLVHLPMTEARGPILWTFRSEDGGGWRGLLVRP
ncbi:MAG: PKD domain-containing protein [Flavobacteriales bacterium]|nr:PKD domain-containing protein [Flavobacteriales bacterium]